jgi:hypothetical protein
MDIDFTIRSTESRDYSSKHGCRIMKVVNINKLLVELIPPIPGYIYDNYKDIETLVLAPRFEGSNLVPKISEWPCRVYMCIPQKEGSWENGQYRILDWGIIEHL